MKKICTAPLMWFTLKRRYANHPNVIITFRYIISFTLHSKTLKKGKRFHEISILYHFFIHFIQLQNSQTKRIDQISKIMAKHFILSSCLSSWPIRYDIIYYNPHWNHCKRYFLFIWRLNEPTRPRAPNLFLTTRMYSIRK